MIEQSWLSTFWLTVYYLQPFWTILFLLFWRSGRLCTCVCVCVRAGACGHLGPQLRQIVVQMLTLFFSFFLFYWTHLLLVPDDVSHVGLVLFFSVCRSVCPDITPLQSDVPCKLNGKVQHSPSVSTVVCLQYLACFVNWKAEVFMWKPTRLYIR